MKNSVTKIEYILERINSTIKGSQDGGEVAGRKPAR